jgi:hypothetical protein
MDKAGDLGAVKQVWLNKCGVVSIILIKLLETITPISYHFQKGLNPGHLVIHTREGNIVVRNIKEHSMSILNTLPYKKMHQLMLIELIYHLVLWFNAFPKKSGVSGPLSP